jgi:hypothetical protein
MGMLASPSGVENLPGREQLRIIYDHLPSGFENLIKFEIVMKKIKERDMDDLIGAFEIAKKEITRDSGDGLLAHGLSNLTEDQTEAMRHFGAILYQLRDSFNMASAQTRQCINN